jgi:hypothetical protein
MRYVGSSVTQAESDSRICVVAQEWEAADGRRERFEATKNDCELPGV